MGWESLGLPLNKEGGVSMGSSEAWLRPVWLRLVTNGTRPANNVERL